MSQPKTAIGRMNVLLQEFLDQMKEDARAREFLPEAERMEHIRASLDRYKEIRGEIVAMIAEGNGDV